jgi:predicted Rossmann fold flavoprotein
LFDSDTMKQTPVFFKSRAKHPVSTPKILYNHLMSTPPIAIIGAGPAGMMAALQAAKAGARVTLIDANAQVGRKLLVTGSGRANLTNRAVSAEKYACAANSDPAWLETLFKQFGPDDLIRFLAEELGLLTYSTADGWVYPVSESAQTVVTAFDSALARAEITLLLGHRVTTIRKSSGGFRLTFADQSTLDCARLLVAAGGKAYPTLGSRGECFPALAELGHSVHPLVPALGPLSADMHLYQRLQGIRLDAHVTLLERADHDLARQDTSVAETTGNLIFTQWGLNGPAVMDLSHHVARNPQSHFSLRLNFLPQHEAQVRAQIEQHRRDPIPLEVIPCSSLPPKMTAFFIEQAGLKPGATLAQVSDAQLHKLMELITALPITVSGVRGFDTCQVSAGGVPLDEVDPQTMQSRLVPGLYLAGETLDVVGPCGGYNLQFAFSTGTVAGLGMAAANK